MDTKCPTEITRVMKENFRHLKGIMTKGGKRYANMEKDGNWFAHAGVEQSEKTREGCTSTGSMLAQGLVQSKLQGERYTKIKQDKKSTGRIHPFSEHDNRASLQDNIEAYDNGLGRKKCLDDRRQHNSHFCLCNDESMGAVTLGRRDLSAFQTEFVPRQSTESKKGKHTSRFPRSHLERSRDAAMAQAGECYLWFGRHDQHNHMPLHVLAASNHSSSS